MSNPKIIFMRSVKDEGKDRLRVLPFQTNENGEPYITDINVQADMNVRKAYPMGTIFASESVVMNVKNVSPYYTANDIFPVSIADGDLVDNSHVPSDVMKDQWLDYKSRNADKLRLDGENATGVFSEDATTSKPLNTLEKMKRNPKYRKPTIESDSFYVNEPTWWDLMTDIENNDNILLIGPAGSGKTELAQLAAQRLGVPCTIFDMGSMFDPVSELLGVHRISSKGTSVFEYANFVKAIQHEGIIVLDELSRATPQVNNILLPLLDNRRMLKVEMAGESQARDIPVHPKCRFVATANIGAEYTGTFKMDLAVDDRFHRIETDYLPADDEVKLLVKRTRIGQNDALNIIKVVRKVREIAARDELERSLTTRDALRAAEKVKVGFTAKEAMENSFLCKFTGTKTEGDRSVVYNTILAR